MMSRTDWDLAEGLDPEGPSASDLDQFGDELHTCPSCQRQVYDQAPLCPHCGHTFEEPPKAMNWWVYFVVLLMVGLMLMFVF